MTVLVAVSNLQLGGALYKLVPTTPLQASPDLDPNDLTFTVVDSDVLTYDFGYAPCGEC